MNLGTGELYEFGPFRLEPDEHLLLRAGRPAVLTPKAFELLVFFVENHGRLITKEQIMRAVWPDSFVEDANITMLISCLRKVLREGEGEVPYIETVPKKGYRFTAPVQLGTRTVTLVPQMGALQSTRPKGRVDGEEGGSRPTSVLRGRGIWAPVVLVICLLAAISYLALRRSPSERSLAVLPLKNLRHDPESDFLGLSLADAIITKLGGLSAVTVRPSSAVEKYQEKQIDIRAVAGELKVDTLLTGNFIRDGDHLRVTYQLVDVRTNNMLYKDLIDARFDELLAVHDIVSSRIIKALQVNLSASDAEQIKPDEPVKPLAYEYYLRGVDLMAKHDFPLAVKMLEKSTKIDDSYPLAWAYLGQAYNSDATFELGGREQYLRARGACEHALALQPKQLQGQVFLANLLVDTGKVEQAVALLRDAAAHSPKNADVHWELGYAYRFAGMLNESLNECLRARQIDPLVKANGSVLNTYLYLGDYTQFVHSLPDVSESAFFRFYRGFAEYHEGDFPRADEDLNRAYEEDQTLYTGIGKAFADSLEKRLPQGLELLRDFEAKIQQRGVGDPEATYKIAQAYAALGDRGSALRALRASIAAGFFAYPYFLRDPLLDRIRNSPEFSGSLNTARQRHEAFKKRFF